jgi:hypothetical protein
LAWAYQTNGNVRTFRWYEGDQIPSDWEGEWTNYDASWFIGSDEAVWLDSGSSDHARIPKSLFSDADWSALQGADTTNLTTEQKEILFSGFTYVYPGTRMGDRQRTVAGLAGFVGPPGSALGAGGAGNTTLFRAVLQGELDDIMAAGMRYRLGPNSYSSLKGFFGTADEAAGFAQKMYRFNPLEGPYTITSTTVPNSFLRGYKWQHLAGEGNGIFIPPPPGPERVFNFSPNPNFRF